MSDEDVRRELERMRSDQAQAMANSQAGAVALEQKALEARSKTLAMLIPVLLEEVAAVPLYEFKREKRISDSWRGGMQIRRCLEDRGDSGWCVSTPNGDVYITLMGKVLGTNCVNQYTAKIDRGAGRGPGFIVVPQLPQAATGLTAGGVKPLPPREIAKLVESALRWREDCVRAAR
ncbi:hypothetical protein [Nocardia suismassiliense]|uniref:hypothetical protein n=1 Tax=Nocardia suismassiliense TaxID=2077092 RepID=UPI000D1DB264|nr:hypothetical protein [Nocardia suismassiliense]